MVPGIILSRPFRREVHGLVHEKWDRVQGARSTVPKSDWSIYVCSGSLIPMQGERARSTSMQSTYPQSRLTKVTSVG